MHGHVLKEMAAAVAPAVREMLYPCVDADDLEWSLSTSKIEEAVHGALSKYWASRIAIVWTTADVRSEAKAIGYRISEDDARSVLYQLLEDHDAGIGIRWEHVADRIRQIGTRIDRRKEVADRAEAWMCMRTTFPFREDFEAEFRKVFGRAPEEFDADALSSSEIDEIWEEHVAPDLDDDG